MRRSCLRRTTVCPPNDTRRSLCVGASVGAAPFAFIPGDDSGVVVSGDRPPSGKCGATKNEILNGTTAAPPTLELNNSLFTASGRAAL